MPTLIQVTLIQAPSGPEEGKHVLESISYKKNPLYEVNFNNPVPLDNSNEKYQFNIDILLNQGGELQYRHTIIVDEATSGEVIE